MTQLARLLYGPLDGLFIRLPVDVDRVTAEQLELYAIYNTTVARRGARTLTWSVERMEYS